MLTDEAMQVFKRHHGMATGAMLARAGISRRARLAMVEAGILEVWYERVYRILSAPITIEARCVALCLAYPRGFITGPTGGVLTKLRRIPRTSEIHFCVPHGTHIGPHVGVRIRQSTKIEKSHVVLRGDGIRIANAARLAFDLASDVSPVDHRSIVEQLLKERKVTEAALARIARQMVHPARPGSQRFLATILDRDGAPAESHPELLVFEGLRRRGIPVVKQVDHLTLHNGKKIRLDMAVVSVRWAVEVDVHPDHLLLDGTSRDKRRDRWVHRIGWQVERVTLLDLLDIEAICDELAELYRVRCEDLGMPAA